METPYDKLVKRLEKAIEMWRKGLYDDKEFIEAVGTIACELIVVWKVQKEKTKSPCEEMSEFFNNLFK